MQLGHDYPDTNSGVIQNSIAARSRHASRNGIMWNNATLFCSPNEKKTSCFLTVSSKMFSFGTKNFFCVVLFEFLRREVKARSEIHTGAWKYLL